MTLTLSERHLTPKTNMDTNFESPTFGGSSIYTAWSYYNAGVYVDVALVFILPTTGQLYEQLNAVALAASVAYNTSKGYTVLNNVWWTPKTIATAPLALVATSGSYPDLLNLPVAPQSYQTIISQTGTSAPTAAITALNTYSGAPTMTLARTGAGVYTITASAAVFSTTKTALFTSTLNNALANLTYVVNSSTVITVTTSINNLTSLLGLGFTATATDGLLSKTMFAIQTYS